MLQHIKPVSIIRPSAGEAAKGAQKALEKAGGDAVKGSLKGSANEAGGVVVYPHANFATVTSDPPLSAFGETAVEIGSIR